jgi:hypothetical protein
MVIVFLRGSRAQEVTGKIELLDHTDTPISIGDKMKVWHQIDPRVPVYETPEWKSNTLCYVDKGRIFVVQDVAKGWLNPYPGYGFVKVTLNVDDRKVEGWIHCKSLVRESWHPWCFSEFIKAMRGWFWPLIGLLCLVAVLRLTGTNRLLKSIFASQHPSPKGIDRATDERAWEVVTRAGRELAGKGKDE